MEHHPDLPPSSFPAKNLCPSFSSAPAGDAAERGSDLHALFEQKINNGDVTEFNDFTEFEIGGLDWAVDIVNINVDANKPILTEQKVSYGEHYFGTADVINENRLFDLKTGEERSYYMQMCAYANALMADNFEMDEVECHILYSKYRVHQKYTISRVQAKTLIDELILRVTAPNPKRATNEYCSWCEHILTCPEIMKPIAHLSGYDLEEDSVPAEEIVLSGEVNEGEAAKVSTLIPIAKAVAAWSKELLNRAKDFEEIPEYKWKEQQGGRFVTDIEQAYHMLDMAKSGGSIERFLECCSLSVSKLESVYGKAIVDLLPIDRKPNIRKLLQDKK